MRDFLFYPAVILLFFIPALAQVKPKPTPSKIPSGVPIKPGTTTTPVGAKITVDPGTVNGRTYTNTQFGFDVTFPDTWLIPDSDFEEQMKKQGFDLGLKAPDSLPLSAQAKINRAIKRVNILLTAYRSIPGAADNTIVRISVENLAGNPQIKDAVDYFDAIRATYSTMKLPADFKYSETQAEKLGAMQFAFLDTSTKAGKKRMYATVRRGYAVMFTISYSNVGDLATMRRILEEGNFSLKRP